MLDHTGLLMIDLFVLRALLQGPASINQMAGADASTQGRERLFVACEALCRRGLVQKTGDTYRLTNRNDTLAWFRQNRPGSLLASFNG